MKNVADSVINYSELRAQKARLGLTVADLMEKAQLSNSVISAITNGDERVSLASVIRLASGLGLRVRVEFEPENAEM